MPCAPRSASAMACVTKGYEPGSVRIADQIQSKLIQQKHIGIHAMFGRFVVARPAMLKDDGALQE